MKPTLDYGTEPRKPSLIRRIWWWTSLVLMAPFALAHAFTRRRF